MYFFPHWLLLRFEHPKVWFKLSCLVLCCCFLTDFNLSHLVLELIVVNHSNHFCCCVVAVFHDSWRPRYLCVYDFVPDLRCDQIRDLLLRYFVFGFSNPVNFFQLPLEQLCLLLKIRFFVGSFMFRVQFFFGVSPDQFFDIIIFHAWGTRFERYFFKFPCLLGCEI